MKVKRLSPEVFCCEEPIVKVDASYIQNLIKKSETCSKKRIRLCAHRTMEDRIHEMLLVLLEGSYIRPHKHINKIESYHVIEGYCDLVLFYDDGTIMDIIELGEYGSGKHFFLRISDLYFHSFIIHSSYVVFHETTNGPFNKADTIFADWAPEENDFEKSIAYISLLDSSINEWKAKNICI